MHTPLQRLEPQQEKVHAVIDCIPQLRNTMKSAERRRMPWKLTIDFCEGLVLQKKKSLDTFLEEIELLTFIRRRGILDVLLLSCADI